jgi:hypothetical protein
VGYGLLVAPKNLREYEDGVGHASRSSSLLHVKATQARVFQFASKLAEARQRVVHVAPSRRSRENKIEDGWVDAIGCVGLLYPKIVIFYVLGPRGILVF